MEELELAAAPCSIDLFLPRAVVGMRGVVTLRGREDQVRAANPHYDDILFEFMGTITEIPSRTPTRTPIYLPSVMPSGSPEVSEPTLSPSASIPSKQPTVPPTKAPSMDIYKFNLIWVPDAR